MMTQILELAVSAIAADSDYQPRAGLDEEHLERLRCSAVADWPPLLVTPAGEGAGYFIIDGFHRYQVAKERQRETLRCMVIADAGYEEAFAANLKHGLPLTMQDRKAYARWLHTAYPEMSIREIGRKAGLSDTTVSQLTSSLLVSKRVSSDGEHISANSVSGQESDAFGQLFALMSKASTENTGIDKLAQFFSGKTDAQQRAEAVKRHLERYEGEERDLMVQAAHIIGQALMDGVKLLAGKDKASV